MYSTGLEGDIALDSVVVCNGANGSNGTNGTNGTNGSNGTNGTNAVFELGAVGPAVAGKTYSACHHDYLYIPDAANGSRGWLTFRHQGNGANDQGIGTTGFQVWNVDISDFNLISEVGAGELLQPALEPSHENAELYRYR